MVRRFMRGGPPQPGAKPSFPMRCVSATISAAMLYDECHIAARDQASPPTRDPPAPSFESIAQRKDVNANSLEHFLKTTHEGLDNPKGMENPGLADFQVKAIVAYILSLRK